MMIGCQRFRNAWFSTLLTLSQIIYRFCFPLAQSLVFLKEDHSNSQQGGIAHFPPLLKKNGIIHVTWLILLIILLLLLKLRTGMCMVSWEHASGFLSDPLTTFKKPLITFFLVSQLKRKLTFGISWKTSLTMRNYFGDKRLGVTGFILGIGIQIFFIATRIREENSITFLPCDLVMGIGVLIKISCKLRRWNFLKGSMVKLPILQGVCLF